MKPERPRSNGGGMEVTGHGRGFDWLRTAEEAEGKKICPWTEGELPRDDLSDVRSSDDQRMSKRTDSDDRHGRIRSRYTHSGVILLLLDHVLSCFLPTGIMCLQCVGIHTYSTFRRII